MKTPRLRGFCNAPGRIRTYGLSLRRRTLYPLSYGRSDGGDATGEISGPRSLGPSGMADRPGSRGRRRTPDRRCASLIAWN